MPYASPRVAGTFGGVRGTSFATPRTQSLGNQNRTNLANSQLQAQRNGQSNPVPVGQQIGGENGYQPISGNNQNWTANMGGTSPANQAITNQAAAGFGAGYQPTINNNDGSSGFASGGNSNGMGSYNPWASGQQGSGTIPYQGPMMYGANPTMPPPVTGTSNVNLIPGNHGGPELQPYSGGWNDPLLFRDAEQVIGKPPSAALPYQGGPVQQGQQYDYTQNPYNHSRAVNMSPIPGGEGPWMNPTDINSDGSNIPSGFAGAGPNNTGLPQDPNSVMRGYAALDENGQGLGGGFDWNQLNGADPPPSVAGRPGIGANGQMGTQQSWQGGGYSYGPKIRTF